METIIGWVGFAIGVIFSIIDALLTGAILAKGGREKNFVLRFLMDKGRYHVGIRCPETPFCGILCVGHSPQILLGGVNYGDVTSQ